MYQASEDIDVLREYEDALMKRPSNYMSFVDGPYETDAPVYSWADRGDDVLAESNFYAMLAMLQGVNPDHVRDAYESHWLVGSLRVIYVQVYADPVDFRSPEPVTLYSEGFRAAVGALIGLIDYPVLDDSDFSEREWTAWESTVNDALDSARRAHDDTPEFDQAVYAILTGGLRTVSGDRYRYIEDLVSHGEISFDAVDWDDARRAWDAVRDELYGEDAARQFEAIQLDRWRIDPSQPVLWQQF
jgi:hypothetical protein